MITTLYNYFDGTAEPADALAAGAQRFAAKFDRKPVQAYVPVGELNGIVKAAALRIDVEVAENKMTMPGSVSFLVGVMEVCPAN